MVLFLWLHHVACGIFVSPLGIEPTLPEVEGGVLTTGPPGKPPGRNCWMSECWKQDKCSKNSDFLKGHMTHVHSGDINNSIFCVLVPGVAHVLFPILIIILQSRFKKKMPVIAQNSYHIFNADTRLSAWHAIYSVAQSCPTLGDPMNCSMPDFPVLHYLL